MSTYYVTRENPLYIAVLEFFHGIWGKQVKKVMEQVKAASGTLTGSNGKFMNISRLW